MGFWNGETGPKQRKNWRKFVEVYNSIKEFDVVFFQIAGSGNIHALGIVSGNFYDDQTLIWPLEFKNKQVLFPWRVKFSIILFSEESIATHYVSKEDYLDGYGIGKLNDQEVRNILDELEERFGKIGLKISLMH